MDTPNKKLVQDFRHWCSEMWFKHREELESFGQSKPSYDSAYYFNKHKWWLKALYKQEQK